MKSYQWKAEDVSNFIARIKDNLTREQVTTFAASIDGAIPNGLVSFVSRALKVDFGFWEDLDFAQRRLSWRDLYSVLDALMNWTETWMEWDFDLPAAMIGLWCGESLAERVGLGRLRELPEGVGTRTGAEIGAEIGTEVGTEVETGTVAGLTAKKPNTGVETS